MAWERVGETNVLRLSVPGGWLYANGDGTVFVPEPSKVTVEHTEALLKSLGNSEHRDDETASLATLALHSDRAYDEGYKDGYEAALKDQMLIAMEKIKAAEKADRENP